MCSSCGCKSAETGKKNCGCGQDPCKTFGAEKVESDLDYIRKLTDKLMKQNPTVMGEYGSFGHYRLYEHPVRGDTDFLYFYTPAMGGLLVQSGLHHKNQMNDKDAAIVSNNLVKLLKQDNLYHTDFFGDDDVLNIDALYEGTENVYFAESFNAEIFEARRSGGKELLKRQEKLLEQYRKNGGDALYYDRLPSALQDELKRIKFHETLHHAVSRWLGDNPLKGQLWRRYDADAKTKLHPGLYRYKGKIGLRKGWTECQECDDLVKMNDINFAYLEGYWNATVCDACVDKYQGFKRMDDYMRENWTSWRNGWGEKKEYSKKYVPVKKRYKWGESEIGRLVHDGIVKSPYGAEGDSVMNAETKKPFWEQIEMSSKKKKDFSPLVHGLIAGCLGVVALKIMDMVKK